MGLGALFPADVVTDGDLSVVENLTVDATAPVGVEGPLQAGVSFVHQVAGPGLAVDSDAAGADAQHPATAVAAGRGDP